jgi:hypothetical protein
MLSRCRYTFSSSQQFHHHIYWLILSLFQRFKPSDYVLFGDSDLLPLHASIYQTDRNWQRKLHIINAFCCETLDGKLFSNPVVHSDDSMIVHLAMCHAGASVSTWNEIFSFDVNEKWDEKGIEQYVKNIFDKGGIDW